MTLNKKRCLAAMIDSFIAAGVLLTSEFIRICIYDITNNDRVDTTLLIAEIIMVMSIYLFRDLVLKNASIGKRLYNIEVINATGGIPSKRQLILRNVSLIFLFYVEYFYLKNSDDRIGDKWAKTKVIERTTR